MRISSAFPSQYLKASDLNGRRVQVRMGHVQVEDIGGDSRPVLYFQGAQKGMVLNKTNANTISIAYGDDTDHWSGQVIELFEAMVDFQGKVTPAIRVFVPRNQQAQAPLAQLQPRQPIQAAAPMQQAAAPTAFNEMNPPPHDQFANGTARHVPNGLDQEVPF